MTRGYYSLIQFCPDLARLEAANVGLLLYCPEQRACLTRFSRNIKHVQQFFGKKQIGAAALGRLRDNFRARLGQASPGFTGVEGLRDFIASEANEVLITDPRPVAVTTPHATLTELFDRLVERPRPKKHTGLRERLDEEFGKPEFDGIIAHDVPVSLPGLGGISLTIPYGYMNGCCHLIQPATFPHDTGGDLIHRTGRLQLESELIQQADMRLVVVGEFPEGSSDIPNRIADLLRHRGVDFYRSNEVNRLIGTIRQTAKPWPGHARME